MSSQFHGFLVEGGLIPSTSAYRSASLSLLLTILFIPHNTNTSENLTILNLLAPLFLPIISLYSTTSSLNICNRSNNRTAPIMWNNLSKSMRTFSNTSPNTATTSQCPSLPLSSSKTHFRSHLKTYLFGISYPP